MKINRISAANFKVFEQMELELQGKSTVIFGINGTGKSTVLSIINYLFRVWVNRLNPSQGKAFEKMSDEIVRIGTSECILRADIEMEDDTYILERKYKKSASLKKKSQLTYDKKLYADFTESFINHYLEQEKCNIPLFVNYGTNRSVLDIPLRIRNKHEFGVISSLDRAIENELDFRTFFEWFRNQEDLENEIKLESGDTAYEDIMLRCVRTAVETMLEDVSDLKVKRNPLCMKVKKNGKEIRVDQLSDGEKCTLALIGDLARRIAIANQYRINPLEGEGVVLIDEIELHMHPSWQRKVLRVLKQVFPNIQFIVTTHSPQVLGEADDSYRIVLLQEEKGTCSIKEILRMDGYDSNIILEEYMNTNSKNEAVKEKISKINHLIYEKKYEEAEDKIEELVLISGDDDPEVITAKGYLQRSKWLDEKNK